MGRSCGLGARTGRSHSTRARRPWPRRARGGSERRHVGAPLLLGGPLGRGGNGALLRAGGAARGQGGLPLGGRGLPRLRRGGGVGPCWGPFVRGSSGRPDSRAIIPTGRGSPPGRLCPPGRGASPLSFFAAGFTGL